MLHFVRYFSKPCKHYGRVMCISFVKGNIAAGDPFCHLPFAMEAHKRFSSFLKLHYFIVLYLSISIAFLTA